MCCVQGGKVTESKADDFKFQIQLPRTILNVSMIVFLALSGEKIIIYTKDVMYTCTGVITLWMTALLGRWYYFKIEKSKKTSINPSINNSISSSLLNDTKPLYYQSI